MAMAIESNYQFRPFFFGGLIFSSLRACCMDMALNSMLFDVLGVTSTA